jgi:hypothetical protein
MIVHFTLGPGMDVAEVQRAIEERLGAIRDVEVQVEQDTPRLTGVEVAAAIAVGIVIARDARKLARDSGKFAEEVLEAVRGVLKKYHALKAEFEVGRKRISANEAKPEDLWNTRARARSGD